jgi:2,3,4,5-tetrahydropyridine-2-carboxylate N-succinyltransferase
MSTQVQIENKESFAQKVKEIQSQAGYKNPIGFGIARVDRGQKNSDKILQATYPLINWKENYGSAAVFIASLEEIGIKVDFSGSEFVASIDKEFLECAKALFNPYVDEANGDKHKNIQVVLSILELAESGVVDVTEAFKMVFIFEDDTPKSVEAVYLKL